MTNNQIQITRYPNRRFYARNESSYVSLEAIEEMVRKGQHVVIRDSQTNQDLTAVVLTRIIMERHPEKMGLFPIDMLHFILRSNDVMMDFLRDYFRHALPYLEYLQRHSAAAINLVRPIHWVKAWLDRIAPQAAAESKQAGHDENSDDGTGPLMHRIAELEERIRQLEAASVGPAQNAS